MNQSTMVFEYSYGLLALVNNDGVRILHEDCEEKTFEFHTVYRHDCTI